VGIDLALDAMREALRDAVDLDAGVSVAIV